MTTMEVRRAVLESEIARAQKKLNNVRVEKAKKVVKRYIERLKTALNNLEE